MQLDNDPLEYSVTQNDTHYVLNITYNHSDHILSVQFLEAEDGDCEDNDSIVPWLLAGEAIPCALVVIAAVVLRRRRTGHGWRRIGMI